MSETPKGLEQLPPISIEAVQRFQRATEVNGEVRHILEDQYEYHPWDADKQRRGEQVRCALKDAAAMIIQVVPPSPDRTTALRKLREARMDCNSAITHDGKY